MTHKFINNSEQSKEKFISLEPLFKTGEVGAWIVVSALKNANDHLELIELDLTIMTTSDLKAMSQSLMKFANSKVLLCK